MKPIYLWAIVVGVAVITGMGTLTNFIDVNSQEFGILNFDVIFREICTGTGCIIDLEAVPENQAEPTQVAIPEEKIEGFDNDVGDFSVKTISLENGDLISAEGCPVSFWGSIKNSNEVDLGTGYWPPGYRFDDKFGSSSYFNQQVQISSGKDFTLHEGLQAQGDGINKLVRQAVAALLNSAHKDIDYPLSISEIISSTQNAIEQEEYSFADELAYFNNLGEATFCEKIE